MQILLSENEYEKMKNDIEYYENRHEDLINKLRDAFIVTFKREYACHQIDVIDIELNLDNLIDIMKELCSNNPMAQEAMRRYIEDNKIKIIYSK